MDVIRIATRRSPLALWQAEEVARRLRARHDGLRCQLLEMTTAGDRWLDAPLAEVGGKSLFVKELEQALLDEHADMAVHSMKDVTALLPPGLEIAVIMERASPYDALVSGRAEGLDALPRGAIVGTSSLRRKCQLRAYRPDLRLVDLRGNVNTRLQRLDAGRFDALVLAAAGLERLGMDARITEVLGSATVLPAIGQGAMGIETRVGDAAVAALVAPLHHPDTGARVAAERAIGHRLGGGCHAPIAGFGELDGGTLRLRGLVGRLDGRVILVSEAAAPREEAEALGRRVAEDLLARGAGEILAELDPANAGGGAGPAAPGRER